MGEVNNHGIIKELAEKFAYNLLSISFEDDDVLKEAIKEVTNNESISPKHKKERFIAVIGAGTSYNANNYIPLGFKASEILMNHYRIYEPLISHEIDRLSEVYKLDKNVFETRLLAINKHSIDLYDQLKRMYNYRFYPDKFYELLSHLLKNRFIDAIVNFNFDELLDQAIFDELGTGEYKKIISDGDIPDFFSGIMKNNRFNIPLYIKPHGTVSHKTSLKFTREAYFDISSDINIFIGDLLSGKLNENDPNPIPVNILVFGFNMESFEFNKLLIENLPNESNIYFFDDKDLYIDKFIQENNEIKVENLNNEIVITYIHSNIKKIIKIYNIRRIDNDTEYSTDNILDTIISEINYNFKDLYKPRNIARHILITKFFSEKTILRYSTEENYNYFKDRVFLEILILVAKSYGFVSLQQMTNDRVGIYYNLYKSYHEKCIKENKISEDILSLFEFCDKLKLKKWEYSRDFYSLIEKNNITNVKQLTILPDDFETDFIVNNELFNRFKSVVSKKLKDKIESDSTYKVSFKDSLNTLFDSEDTEICPSHNNVHDNIFKYPQVIRTRLALDFHTKTLFRSGINSWDTLLTVAETGEWLTGVSSTGSLTNKKITVIVADNAYNNKLNNTSNLNIYQLNWWLHNQHMSIFLKLKDKNKEIKITKFDEWKTLFEQVKVIYFHRRTRSTLINPVLLTEDSDIELVLKTFFAYLAESEYMRDSNYLKSLKLSKNASFVITNDIVEAVAIEYFNNHIL